MEEKKTKECKTLTLKNYQLNFFLSLLNVPLHGQELRSKTQIVKVIIGKTKDNEAKRIAIAENYAEKDEKGKPKVENNNYVLTDENKVKMDKEYKELLEDDCVIDILPSIVKDMAIVKKIILESKKDFDKNNEGILYDEICEILEKY